jgi:hypothetical protein
MDQANSNAGRPCIDLVARPEHVERPGAPAAGDRGQRSHLRLPADSPGTCRQRVDGMEWMLVLVLRKFQEAYDTRPSSGNDSITALLGES